MRLPAGKANLTKEAARWGGLFSRDNLAANHPVNDEAAAQE